MASVELEMTLRQGNSRFQTRDFEALRLIEMEMPSWPATVVFEADFVSLNRRGRAFYLAEANRWTPADSDDCPPSLFSGFSGGIGILRVGLVFSEQADEREMFSSRARICRMWENEGWPSVLVDNSGGPGRTDPSSCKGHNFSRGQLPPGQNNFIY